MVTFYVWQISMKDVARDDGYGAPLPPSARLSNPHTLCTADHTAETEAKVLNSIPACIAGLNSISGLYYEKLHNSRCQLR